MATLDKRNTKKRKKRKKIVAVITLVLGTLINMYVSKYVFELVIVKFKVQEIPEIRILDCFMSPFKNSLHMKILLVFEAFILLSVFMILTKRLNTVSTSKTMIVAGNIELPVAVGEGQNGTSRFLNEDELIELFCPVLESEEQRNENLGLVVGTIEKNKKKMLLCIAEDINTIIIGATRSGKTRRMMLVSIWMKAKTNNSMVITDIKGELYLYTRPYLEENGFDVKVIDFRETDKSMRNNYLKQINDAVDANDINKAVDYTWDIVSSLVGKPKGEPLWTNGEAACIACAILAVVLEAPREYRNMTNVYYFLANMCRPDAYGEIPITSYLEGLREDHPARAVFAAAEISPEKMRGSFFGSALVTLRLFSNANIADLTSDSDFDMKDIGRRKTALFIIAKDENETLYSLISLLVTQCYVNLVELANECGNRLLRNVDFFIDECGNFPTIAGFGSMISVGAGRGIRFSLVFQAYQQLEKYYKEDYKNIKGNCVATVYLKSPDNDTLEELSKRTGSYTVQTNNASTSISSGRKSKESYSSSAGMQKRALLMPEEIGRIEKPYGLLLYSGNFPAIVTLPDLTEYKANRDFGMGTPEENRKLLMERSEKRERRQVKPVALWKVWKRDENENPEEKKKKENSKVSFLNFDEEDFED